MDDTPLRPARLLVRAARAEDQAFVEAATRRLAEFGPPAWRSAGEIVAAETRTLRRFFEGASPDSDLLIAERAGQPLGYVLLETLQDYFTEQPHGHVGILSVAREAQGQGAAGALLRAAERWARGRGFSKLTLAVFERNRHARDVYEHFGYAPEILRYVKTLPGSEGR
jgi:GNAT superfamily N-acetyltransferase